MQKIKESNFYEKLKKDLNVFSSISLIIEKIQQDGNLYFIENTIKKVIKNEIQFTKNGILKRIKKNKKEKS